MPSKAEHQNSKANRHNAVLGCGCLLSPFLLLVLLVLGTTFYNNFRLWRFERNFTALEHPTGTKFLNRSHEIGLFGNSNHCDFKVVELRSFTGSPKLIQQFYATKRLPVPNNEDEPSEDVQQGTQPVQVEVLPSPLPPRYKWGWEYMEPFDLSSFAGQKSLYVVYIVNIGPSNSWETMCDWRCS